MIGEGKLLEVINNHLIKNMSVPAVKPLAGPKDRELQV